MRRSDLWYGPMLVLAVALVASAARAEEPKGGTVTGLLVAKGETWIEVRAEDAKDAVRYTPRWLEGGLDPTMVATLKKLVVPNRVKLTWQFEERPRVLAVEVIKPEKTEGSTTGVVTAKGEKWIDIKSETGVTERYTPRWIGGNPQDGGGFDKAMLETIKATAVGAKVKVEWKYDERLRVLAIGAA